MPTETDLRAAIEELANEARLASLDNLTTSITPARRGGRFVIAVAGAVAAVVLAAVLVARFTGRESTPSAASSACRDPGRLTPRECAIALRVAHHRADRAEPHGTQERDGWPANIRIVAASARSGTVKQPNVGPPCRSGRLLSVDLIGSFDIVVSPPPGVEHTAVHDVHLYVDGDTGRACLLTVRTGHAVVPPDATVLFRRK